jgi:hypothetical protein
MALQKNTLALLTLALLLGSGVLLYERFRGGSPSGTTPDMPGTDTANRQPLFNFKEDDVQAFTITLSGQTLAFERNPPPAQPTPGQPAQPAPGQPTPQSTPSQPTPAQQQPTVWRMISPKAGPANDASVAFLLNLLATGSSESQVEVEASKLKEFGLDPAPVTILVTLKNRQQHRLVLGGPTYNQAGIYGQVDPPASSPAAASPAPSPTGSPAAKIQVKVLPVNFMNAVSRPLTEWEPAPVAPTPTPTLLTPPPSIPPMTVPPATESPAAPTGSPAAPTVSPAPPSPTQPSPTQSSPTAPPAP